jgi:hypothetical protein
MVFLRGRGRHAEADAIAHRYDLPVEPLAVATGPRDRLASLAQNSSTGLSQS